MSSHPKISDLVSSQSEIPPSCGEQTPLDIKINASRDTWERKMNNNDYYYPTINKHHRYWNLMRLRGFVKISAMFSCVLIFSISKVPLQTFSWKWWYFIKMCFSLGLKGVSVVERTIHALLSLNTLDGGKDGVWITSREEVSCREMKLWLWISIRIWHSGSRSWVAID